MTVDVHTGTLQRAGKVRPEDPQCPEACTARNNAWEAVCPARDGRPGARRGPSVMCTRRRPSVMCTRRRPSVMCTRRRPSVMCTRRRPSVMCTRRRMRRESALLRHARSGMPQKSP
ncbi:hypothetical protein CENSYa_0748 [Cenarchaeum symbiosum A]|uniref:Uncharacterized protein n=1 Tax=Cenarchaeum symbiosum (strain A) TaxID=414004 RepID=A0RVL4_CENSY|nr:hypothetical protein CENSYa_0748 [Cenarchaeum symbiosum A]